MLRVELNRPLNFAKISEANWDSVFRRSLVIEMNDRSPPSEEFECPPVERGDIWNSREGDAMQQFLESGPASLAFIRVL